MMMMMMMMMMKVLCRYIIHKDAPKECNCHGLVVGGLGWDQMKRRKACFHAHTRQPRLGVHRLVSRAEGRSSLGQLLQRSADTFRTNPVLVLAFAVREKVLRTDAAYLWRCGGQQAW